MTSQENTAQRPTLQPPTRPRGLVVAGTSGGSGKSMAAIGLAAALGAGGLRVGAFKKGPDYIDAGWLAQACGRPCCNLDPYLMGPETLRQSFARHIHGLDFVIVEGNRGLHDGVRALGGSSTADLALLLDLPVLLVVSCVKVTRTVAALVLGCRDLDPRVRFAGVVLNQVATARQEGVIREAVEHYTGLPVLGVIPRQRRDPFPMRHLGVTPHQEYQRENGENPVERLAALVRERFDLPRLLERAAPLPPALPRPAPARPGLRIGILRDRAFQFYYEENLDALRQGGAAIVEIDALAGAPLPPDLDALYIGGGFPETSAQALADNQVLRDSVRRAAQDGLPIYAECGGLIFLGRSIVLEGREYPLAGVFPVTFGLSARPQAHGYSRARVEGDNAFYGPGTVFQGHEFRYSTILHTDLEARDLCLAMERGTGFMQGRDGLCIPGKNVLALYTHVLAPATPQWARGLLAAAARHAKQTRGGRPRATAT